MVYCSKCGAEMPEGAGFCPKCGAPAGMEKDTGMYMDRHAWRRMRREMRATGSGWYWSPEYRLLRAVMAGLFIVLLGGLLLMCAWEVTPLVTWANFWAYLLLGAGALILIQYLLGFLIPGRTYHGIGALVVGVLFMALGAAGLSAFYVSWAKPLWPLIIVAGGVLVIAVAVAVFLGTNKA
ncbi:MAG TPA: zinc ribbon domain-containing protein [Methanocella sp.]|uniref:zinc ribbon domain-containing protein n=1 Tax=Methanocella sp. TaxID=2052833 RepID=UPI002C455DEF|nr:zinc ribbon domain-containing protein [Methanocella sp.]HTY90545.1 zinc ribbon domain-containing protein [Methanocella sp.]